MEIPAEWIAAMGLAFTGALGLWWRFFTGHLEKHTESQQQEIHRLQEKQDRCEETTLDLTSRVARLEGEHDAVMRVSAEVIEEIRKLGGSNGPA